MVEENDMFGKSESADGPHNMAILGIGVLIVEPSRLVNCVNIVSSQIKR